MLLLLFAPSAVEPEVPVTTTRGGGGKTVYIGQFSGRDPEKLKKLREEQRKKKQNAALMILLH